MPKALLQFKFKFLVIEVPDTTWPMLMAEDFFLPNKMLCVALMTHHSTGSVCRSGFFLTFGKKLKAKKTQNSRKKLKAQGSSPKSWHFLKTFGLSFVKNLQVL